MDDRPRHLACKQLSAGLLAVVTLLELGAMICICPRVLVVTTATSHYLLQNLAWFDTASCPRKWLFSESSSYIIWCIKRSDEDKKI